jgi:uncharacterized repeat protein (TIGR01451 family)
MLSQTSFANDQLDLAAMLLQQQDASVTTSASRPAVHIGELAQLNATVSNLGPASQPIRFADVVPAGLTVVSAVAGHGTCSVAGQRVSCTITGLGPGQRAPVSVTVAASRAGVFANRASVTTTAGEPDPTPANNSAGTSLSCVPRHASSRSWRERRHPSPAPS